MASLIKNLSKAPNFSFSSPFFFLRLSSCSSMRMGATRSAATRVCFAVQGVKNVENN